LKILHVDPEAGFGGGERQVLGLVRHLARRGFENLLGAAPGSALSSTLPAGDAEFLPLAIRNHLDVRAALALSRWISERAPDVVHFHTSRAHAMSLFLPGSAARSLVTRRMDYALRRGWRTRLLYNRRVAAVAAISEEVRRQLLAAGVEAGRVRVIHSGVEVPDALPGPAGRAAARSRFGANGEIVIAVVAALERRKGQDVLLEALSRVRRERSRFLCLLSGDGSERAALEARAANLGLDASVRFLGYRPQVADLLAAADVFVMPSRKEGLGVAILEAMAMALPVVASAVGGIPESVEDGRSGILVPPDDPEALAAAFVHLARGPEEARAMGRRGRERVLTHFTMAGMAGRYADLYESMSSCLTARDRR